MATKINWCDEVVNPIGGCTRVSPGCDNCFAANMSFRQHNMGTELYKGTAVWVDIKTELP